MGVDMDSYDWLDCYAISIDLGGNDSTVEHVVSIDSGGKKPYEPDECKSPDDIMNITRSMC